MPLAAASTPVTASEFRAALELDEPWLSLFSANPDLARAFLRMLGGSTPELGMRTAEKFRNNGFPWAKSAVLNGWFATDPVPAARWYLGHRLEDGQLGVEAAAWESLVEAGGALPVASELAAMTVESPEASRNHGVTLTWLLRAWSRGARGEALAWIDSVKGDPRSFEPRKGYVSLLQSAFNGFVLGWAEQSPLEAVNWALTFAPAGKIRENAFVLVEQELARRGQLDTYASWLEENISNPDALATAVQLGQDLVKKEPEKALAWAARLSREDADEILSYGAFMLSSKTPADAIRFVEKLSPAERKGYITLVAGHWATIDAAGAEAYLARSTELTPEDKERFSSALASRRQ